MRDEEYVLVMDMFDNDRFKLNVCLSTDKSCNTAYRAYVTSFTQSPPLRTHSHSFSAL